MSELSWVNGQKTTQLSTFDRSVHYGDGFFTTILVMQNRLYNWSAHWWRLQNSAKQLGFPVLIDLEIRTLIESAYVDFTRENISETPLAIKLIISRGTGGRGYQALEQPNVTTIVQISPHPVFKEGADLKTMQTPIELGLCKTLCAIQPSLAGLKHLNRLENVMARNELHGTTFTEALMLNAYSEVVCATQSNLFIIKGNQLITPRLNNGGVAGTTRFQMPKIAKACGFDYHEQVLSLQDIREADELFLTNALRGLMPIKQFQQAHYDSKKTESLHCAWSRWQIKNALALSERLNGNVND